MRKPFIARGARMARAVGSRFGLVLFELLAVVALVLVLAVCAAAWRLSQGPVDVSFAGKYIAQSLYDPATDTAVQAGRVQLSWRSFPAGCRSPCTGSC